MALDAIRLWLRALFRRERVESEMEKEMQIHLDMETEANIRRGMSPDEARRRALIAFGGVDRHQEDTRDQRATRGIEELLCDFRFAARSLRKRPGFALLATLTLAIGIGATAGIYTIANWVLLRPIPGVVRPSELAIVSFEDGPGQSTGFSYAMLSHVARFVDAFTTVAGTQTRSYQLGGSGVVARTVDGAIVAGDYFGGLGVQPARGRFFTSDELGPSSDARVAVISERLWRWVFGGDTAILGRTVRINATELTIVGVAPRAFRGLERTGPVDVWFPASLSGQLRHMPLDLRQPSRRVLWVLVGRLRDGATIQLAQAQMDALVNHLLRAEPRAFGIHETHRPKVYEDAGTPVFGRKRTVRMFVLLFTIVGVVLLIACANVANLLLLRGLSRRPEFTVRKALGASTWQLLRLHTAEGIVVGLLGGAIGVAVALFVAMIFEGQQLFSRGAEGFAIDIRVLGFVFLLAASIGIVFGLVPGFATVRSTKRISLADAGRGTTTGKARVRAGLTVLQVAGSVALVVVAALLTRTINALAQVQLGFEPRQLTAVHIEPSPQGYTPERRRLLRERLADVLSAQPGVEGVAVSTYGIPQTATFFSDFRLTNDADDKWRMEAAVSPVASGYFATLRIPFLAGRDFEKIDQSSDEPVILNATAARQLYNGLPAAGALLVQRGFDGEKVRRVVGVVADARGASVRDEQGPVVYTTMSSSASVFSDISIIVRSERPFADVDAMIRRAASDFDASLPISPPTPVTKIVQAAAREERVFLKLVALLGSLALSLAAVGLYGVTAYAVAQRRRELGIRIALGAGVRKVVATVTRQAVVIVAVGVTVGLGAAAGFARALQSMLFGVGRLDPASYSAAALAFAVVALLACIVPARAAARVDPIEALRAE